MEGRARVEAVEGEIVDEMLVMGGCCVLEGGSRGWGVRNEDEKEERTESDTPV